jgi:ssDNA-binding Zn-finger/Zn-ribbon topoisomerase 1
MNTIADVDFPDDFALPIEQITGGRKLTLGDCPKCGKPLKHVIGIVRCSDSVHCDFVEQFREFVKRLALDPIEEERFRMEADRQRNAHLSERNIANIRREEKLREGKKPGILGRFLGRR